MINLTSGIRAQRIARVFGVLNLVAALVGGILTFTIGGQTPDTFLLTFILTAISYNMLAILIISKHPHHMVGWIFLVIGWLPSFTTFFRAAVNVIGLNSGSVSDFGELVGYLAFFPTYLLPITLVLQYFPTGRLPSQRWRLLPVFTVLAMVGMLVNDAILNLPIEALGIDQSSISAITNNQRFLEQLLNLTQNAFGLGMLGSLAAVIVRYRRSRGIERLQMKWLVYVAVIGITTLVLIEPAINLGSTVIFNQDASTLATNANDFVLLSLPVLFSLVIGIAILRHRLFDIDVIIRRTLQYTILTGILALVYFGLVILLQTIFSAVEGQQSPIFIVISTLVIAGLFNPLRKRLQEMIDRRFYRKKYESKQALDQFANAARDEVDLDELTAALLGVVAETIQPQSISLWLIKADREK